MLEAISMLVAYLFARPMTVLSSSYSHALLTVLSLWLGRAESAAETKLDISLLVSRLSPLH